MEDKTALKFSKLAKTWIIDVDGTIVKHNGYLTDGFDSLLPCVQEFFKNVSDEDKIILLTARSGKYIDNLKEFLDKNNLRYDYILSDMPMGERILINDEKPSGLKTAYSINLKRDEGLSFNYTVCEEL